MPQKSLSCHFTTNIRAWNSPNSIGTLTRTVFYGQMKRKFSFLATKVGLAWKMEIPKTVCKYGGVGGSVMLLGCFSSKGPGNVVRVHGIIISMKYQDILNLNLAAPARKLKLVCCWIFVQMATWPQKQAYAMAISVPWPKPVGWRGECTREELGFWII